MGKKGRNKTNGVNFSFARSGRKSFIITKGGAPVFFFFLFFWAEICWQHHLAASPFVEQYPSMPTPENVDFSTGRFKGNIH